MEHLGTFPYLLDGTKFRVWLYLVEKDSLGIEDVSIFAEEHSGKKCIGMDALAAMCSLRADHWENFTAIDRHIIANYVPDVVVKVAKKDNGIGMRSISKAF